MLVQHPSGRTSVAGRLPALLAAANLVEQCEHVRPAVHHLYGERRQAELATVPERYRHERVHQARRDEPIVLGVHHLRVEHEQHQRDSRSHKRQHGGVDVVAEARQVPRASADWHLEAPELAAGEQAH